MAGRGVSVGRVITDTGRQYWGRTGVGGLANAYSADRRPLRLIWLALFTAGLVVTVMDVVDVIEDYYTYPHTTTMEVVYDRSAHFPAVTVCSESRIDCERLLNASLHEPTSMQLGMVLQSSHCLSKSGLECPYVWILAAQYLTEQWLTIHQASCLKCSECEGIQNTTTMLKRNPKMNAQLVGLERVYALIGCNTTCPPPPTSKKFAGSGSADSPDGDVTGLTDTAGDGTSGSAGTPDAGTGDPTATAGDGDVKTTDTAGPPTTEPTGTTEGSTASSGTGLPTGTVDGEVLKRAKRAADEEPVEEPVEPGEPGEPVGEPDEVQADPRRKKLDAGNFKASRAYDEKMQRLNYFMALKEDVRLQIGIAREDFIKDCSYLGTSCNDDLLFRTTSSPEYGNCFTFNANVTESSDPLAGERVTGLTGQQYSLDLLLDLNHHTFPPVAGNKGARVQVHQPDQQPEVEDSGLSVMPNAATSIAIEQLTIRRLPFPYESRCISSWNDADYGPSPIDEDVKESYSTTRCQKMCLQTLFIERCGCQHAKYPEPHTFSKRGSPQLERIRPCLLTAKGNDTVCTNVIQQEFDNGTVSCHCPSACFERSFNTFQSMALWPRDVYLFEAASQMNINASELTPSTRAELASNILEIKVFFKTLNTASLSQSASYTYSSFFSSLGGAMSLYLGISIIMVAEVVEFLLLLVWNLIRRSRGTYVSPDTTESVSTSNRVGEVKKVSILPNGIQITYIGDDRALPPLEKHS